MVRCGWAGRGLAWRAVAWQGQPAGREQTAGYHTRPGMAGPGRPVYGLVWQGKVWSGRVRTDRRSGDTAAGRYTWRGLAGLGAAARGSVGRGTVWRGEALDMPKSRQPKEVWRTIRAIVWERDERKCVRCQVPVALSECHIDHKISGKRGSNRLDELRTLCRRCHVLRADFRHRGMIASALRDEIIPPDWRSLVWED